LKDLLLRTAKDISFLGLFKELYCNYQKRRFFSKLQSSKEKLLLFPVKNVSRKKDELLNIVQISTYDNLGGAALVAFRLYNIYRGKGHHSIMFVGYKSSKDENVINIMNSRDDAFREICQEEGLLYWNFLSSFNLANKAAFKDGHILHFHNVHGYYFSYHALPGLTRLKPTVWTLHDMQSITGHCAFSYDCGKWETGCGDCPLLDASPALEKDTTAMLWKDKKELYREAEVDIVVPSKWLYNIVKKSILSDKDVHLIYNGIDTSLFKPKPKSEMRRKFNIDSEKIVFITSIAGGMKNSQKGASYLLEALKKMEFKKDIVLICMGEKDESYEIEGVTWMNTGHIFCEEKLAEWYCAADLFLYPSLADNCPLAVLEAMACGLPVVTFATGGIPELVKHMETGYVARYRDIDDFIKGIETFLYDRDLGLLAGKMARINAENNFSLHQMTASYLDLYYNVINKRYNSNKS